MRYLAVTLLLSFAAATVEAAIPATSNMHTVAAKKGKKVSKSRKGKRVVKHTGHA